MPSLLGMLAFKDLTSSVASKLLFGMCVTWFNSATNSLVYQRLVRPDYNFFFFFWWTGCFYVYCAIKCFQRRRWLKHVKKHQINCRKLDLFTQNKPESFEYEKLHK